MKIVRLTSEHVTAIAKLEKNDGDVGWSADSIRRELILPQSRFFVGLNPSGDVMAYGVFWKVDIEAQIVNLVVRRENRRQGLGRQMVTHLLTAAQREACQKCFLEVRRGNTSAQSLYGAAGFIVTGARPNFYVQPTEDALLMEFKF